MHVVKSDTFKSAVVSTVKYVLNGLAVGLVIVAFIMICDTGI